MPCQARCARATISKPCRARRPWSSPWRSGSTSQLPRCSQRQRAVSRPTVRSKNAAATTPAPAQRREQDQGSHRRRSRRATPARQRPPGAATKRRPASRRARRRSRRRGRRGRRAALHGLACLEGDATGGSRKGVQRRDFLKKHRFELSGLGGFYASDALSSTYSYGGALAFYPSEDFGLELLVTRSPMQFRLEEPFTAFDQQHALLAQRRLAGDRLAALVADSRQVQVQRHDHRPRRSLRGRGRRAHRSTSRCWD